MRLENTLSSIVMGVGFITVTDVRPEQSSKARVPMLVTLEGMVMEVRPEHQEKAYSPMLVTLLGMVMEVRP